MEPSKTSAPGLIHAVSTTDSCRPSGALSPWRSQVSGATAWRQLARAASDGYHQHRNKRRQAPNSNEASFALPGAWNSKWLPWPPLQLGEQIGAGTFSAVHRAVLNESRYQVYEYAVKRFYQTNDPRRIQQEVRFLCELEGEPGVPRLEGVFRRDNEVWLVMPLYRCEPFRLLIAEMRVSDMRAYMRQLLKVLAVLERHEIIHRDVKPGNFLFHRAYPGSAVLVDFGLAQWHRRAHKLRHGVHRLMPDMYAAKLQPSSAPAQNSRHLKLTTTREHFEDWQLAMTAPVFAAAPTGTTKSTTGQSARTILPSRQKPRALVEAPRAGTRGFRAPEILLRFLEQDTRIDVWSAGVIFLSMLSRRYPFFRANGDDEALLELEQVLGTERLAATAKACHRSFASAERMPGMDLRHLCLQLRTAQRPTEAVDTDIPDEAFDLLGKMLEPNCFQRPRASDLQDHPFLRDPHA